jgi:mannan endo-1,4-beta-mannosidase
VLVFEVAAHDGKLEGAAGRVLIFVGYRNGLRAEYFAGVDLSGVPLVTVDSNIMYNWLPGTVAANGLRDNYSVRWSGKITSRYSERYTILTTSDDGVRVFINGTKIIDAWNDHAAQNDSGTFLFRAGVPYDIRVEFYERAGDARIELKWFSRWQRLEIIPSSALTPF